MTTPFDLYLQCKELIGKQNLPNHPFFNLYQPLSALRAKDAKSVAPFLTETGRAPLCSDVFWPQGSFPNIRASFELALLWAMLSKKTNDPTFLDAANKLAGFLEPLITEKLTTLWTMEKEYQEEQDLHACHLFLQAIGKSPTKVVDSFFDPTIALEPNGQCLNDPSIGYELLREEQVALAITASGDQTMAGACRIGDIEIRAFGPHLAPLSNSELFGIGPGEEGWFCASAAKEIWCKIRGEVDPRGLTLFLNSAGITSEKPMAFVFYLRAKECVLGAKVLKPKSLARIITEKEQVTIRGESTEIIFSCTSRQKIEVIPLAGEKAFWGSSFLLAVWLPAFHATTEFRFLRCYPNSRDC